MNKKSKRFNIVRGYCFTDKQAYARALKNIKETGWPSAPSTGKKVAKKMKAKHCKGE